VHHPASGHSAAKSFSTPGQPADGKAGLRMKLGRFPDHPQSGFAIRRLNKSRDDSQRSSPPVFEFQQAQSACILNAASVSHVSWK